MLRINQAEAQILMQALNDCKMKQLAKGKTPEQIQDLYSRLFDYVNDLPERPVRGQYNKRKLTIKL